MNKKEEKKFHYNIYDVDGLDIINPLDIVLLTHSITQCNFKFNLISFYKLHTCTIEYMAIIVIIIIIYLHFNKTIHVV